MVSDVAAEKLGQWFDMLDTAGHGYLIRGDFLAVADRVARSAGVAQAPALTEAYLNLWTALADGLGMHPDGKLSREQYIRGVATLARADPRFVESSMVRICGAGVALYDTDADGRLSREEFLTMLAAFGVSAQRAQIAHLALDKNADGYIFGEDMLAAAREFILSDDPHAFGNWLFGGLEPKPIRYY